jgi:glycosyltransferase involved in cell wall biosynthesis
MDSLYIIIPAYNEKENIERCVADWYPIVENHNDEGKSRLVVINDGSKDNTYDMLCSMKDEYPLLVPLTKENGGHGSTVLFGYRYAIENRADYIFQTDSDGQTNPEEFEEFWQNREKYDALIGERLKREDGNGRKFVESVVCILLKLIFGVSAKDANAPFRLMKSSLIDKYINRLPADFNIPNIMFTTYFLYYNESMKFIPISFEQRAAGKTSINLKKIMRIGLRAVGDFRRLKRDM